MREENYKGKVISTKQITANVVEIKIQSVLAGALPGQFISLLCPGHTMRRPFSIVDYANGVITILVKYVGDATKYLASLKVGDKVEFLAPLGNAFAIERKNSLLIAGGIGIAPLLFLKKQLTKNEIKNHLVAGFKERSEVIPGSDENVIGGSVLDSLEKIFRDGHFEVVYACGPVPVLKGAVEFATKNHIPSYVALEKVMACSIGVCRGCTIKIKENNVIKRVSVCKDGVIFKGSEVIWE